MNQVGRILLQWIRQDIMLKYLEVLLPRLVYEAWIEISGHD